ncbi:MAG TPA: glycosyltransferase N-terminal domain-containing protein [Chlamydiales bacterium]|nr:glycosyltransferase N-terminal domain-containing protein [Chlamydiales bacterium]
MFDFFYNLAILGYFTLGLPYFLYQMIRFKKYRKGIKQRLGIFCLKGIKKEVVWIHAVSVGETHAAKPLIEEIRKKRPDVQIIVSNITETGHKEAEKLFPYALCIYMPIDLSWIVSKILKQIKIQKVFFIETDVWYNFIRVAKNQGAKCFLISAKMSDRSFKRFQKFQCVFHKLYDLFDGIYTQNEEYFIRYQKLGFSNHLKILGNLKLAEVPIPLSIEEKEKLKEELSIQSTDWVITIGSTHPNEEKLILQQLLSLMKQYDHLKIILAPRHPERTSEVISLLNDMSISFGTYLNKNYHGKQLILIDVIGILNQLYAISNLAIVGGSFVPIGGHHILEPVFEKVPVIFGPYMSGQREFEKIALENHVGLKLSVEALSTSIQKYLLSKHDLDEFKENCERFVRGLNSFSFPEEFF